MGVTLGKKTLCKGKISLYIDYCYQNKRKKQYLGIILERPDTPEIRKENRSKMLLAQRIKAKKELEFLATIYDMEKPKEEFKELFDIPKDGQGSYMHFDPKQEKYIFDRSNFEKYVLNPIFDMVIALDTIVYEQSAFKYA